MTDYYPEDFDPNTNEIYKNSYGYAVAQATEALSIFATEAALAMKDFEYAMYILAKNPLAKEKKRCIFDE